jgi:hypothetical protein
VVTVRVPSNKSRGLRHAFASVANELGYTEATRAALLGHAGTHGQTGDLTHHLDSVLVAAANRVSERIRDMMNDQKDRPGFEKGQ